MTVIGISALVAWTCVLLAVCIEAAGFRHTARVVGGVAFGIVATITTLYGSGIL